MSCVESGCIFEWTIEDIQFYLKENRNRNWISPEFPLTPSSNIFWCVEMECCVNLIKFYLKRSSEELELRKIKFYISVQIDDSSIDPSGGEVSFGVGEGRKTLCTFVLRNTKNLYGNRHLIILCRFDCDSFRDEKRTLFYYIRKRPITSKYFFEEIFNVGPLCFPVGSTFKRKIRKSFAKFTLRIARSPFTLRDIKLLISIRMSCVVLVKVTFLNCLGKVMGTGKCVHFFDKHHTLCEIGNFEVSEERSLLECLPDHILRMNLEMEQAHKYYTFWGKIENVTKIEMLDDGSISELNPYAPLREGNVNYVICVGNRKFKFNKDYIRAVSPYFKSLVEENRNLSSIPDDLEVEDTQNMLDILRCEKRLDKNTKFEELVTFYKLSHKFQIIPLRKMFLRAIASVLSETNLNSVFSLAHTYQDSELHEAAQNYFNAHARDVLKQTRWSSFSEENPKLACEILMTAIQATQ